MRGLIRMPWAWSIAVLAACTAAVGDELADRLAPHVGATLDLVELGTGKRFVRPTLEAVVQQTGTVNALRLKPEGESRTLSIRIPAIVKIIAGRDTLHDADGGGTSASHLRGRRRRDGFAKQAAESRERMAARGVHPWPVLSGAEHAAEVELLRAFVADVQREFPDLEVRETHEFIVATDIPSGQIAPYVASLDAMHDLLCDLYAIPKGEPVWKGKGLVIAFQNEGDFLAFEARFMRVEARGVHGLCHQGEDGRVVMACHRGNDAGAFAHMLVHETSHGFNHRWMSPERLPNWLNEGLAEWVGAKVVPNARQVSAREMMAVEHLRKHGDLGPEFFEARNIQPVQYGMASAMVRFLVDRDPGKFAAFVQGIKEGVPVEESLRAAFAASLDDLVKAYGTAVGVAGLRR